MEDIDITIQYFENEDYVKVETKQNYRDVSKYNYDIRWQYDNRIAVGGFGMLNPTCDRNFVINSGIIGWTDFVPMRKRIDNEDTNEVRNIRYNGSDNWITQE